jgi:hypothetical protein
MYEPHKLVGVFAVLFAIAQKDIRVKRRANARRRFVTDKNGVEIRLQLIRVLHLGGVGAVGTEILPFAKLIGARINGIYSRFHHERQNGDVFLLGECNIRVHSAVRLYEQLERNGNDKEVHLTKLKLLLLLGHLLTHILGVKNYAIVGFENIVTNLFKVFVKIIRMASKIHPRFFINANLIFRFKFKNSHNVLLFNAYSNNF